MRSTGGLANLGYVPGSMLAVAIMLAFQLRS
jgi:hypothetical protein